MSISSPTIPKRVHQRPGIALGLLAGGEAGHGEAENIRARQPEIVAGPGGDDQGMGGIEPARHADDEVGAAGRPEAADQALDLDVERLVAILIELLGAVGDVGEAAQRPLEADILKARLMVEADAAEARLGMAGGADIVVERAVAHPLQPQPLDVHVGDGKLGLPFETAGLGEQFAKLVDRALPVPGEVGRALAGAGGREDISGEAAAGLRRAQQLALVGLADGDVGRGEVGEDEGAGHRAQGGGRLRRPIILANLDVEDEVGKVVGGEDEVRAERRRLPRHLDLQPVQADAGGEPAFLVIFAVIGEEAFRHDAEDGPAGDGEAAIVEPAVAAQGRADHQHGLQTHAFPGQPRQPVLDRVEEGVLEEQVVDRVGGDVQLREDGEVHAARVRLARQRQRLVDVEGDVADRGDRARRRHPDEAVAVDRSERGLRLLRRLRHLQHLRHHLDRDPHRRDPGRAPAHGTEMLLPVQGYTPRTRAGEMNQPRLLAFVGKAGNGKRDVGAREGQRAFGHGDGDLLRDRAPGGDQVRGDAEHVGLGLRAVGNEAAVEDVGDVRDVGQQRGEHAAGAALGGGEDEAAFGRLGEQAAGRLLDLIGQHRRERLGLVHNLRPDLDQSRGTGPLPRLFQRGNQGD